MAEWQPIETAPKDGRSLLLYSPSYNGPAGPIWVGNWVNDDVEHAFECMWGVFGVDYPATHWMPLPDPPTAKTDAPCPGAGLNPRHEWFYDHHRAGMLCGKCGQFVSDMT